MNSPSVAIRQILLVEDNPGDVTLLTEAAREAGLPAEIHVVADGQLAMDYLLRKPPFEDVSLPDLILLDLNLPVIHGSQVLSFIKDNPELREITTVILTTCNDLLREVDQARGCPADDYLLKPTSWDRYLDLVTFLRQYL